MKWLRWIGGAVMLVSAAAAAFAQVPPAASVIPEGYQVTTDRKIGPMIFVEARRIDGAKPEDYNASDNMVGYGWQPNPMAAQTVEMMLKQPEAPESPMGPGGSTMESAGKQAYRGGVLTWKKRTSVSIGSSEPAKVTLEGSWVGVLGGGVLSVGVRNFPGTKDAAQRLIDGMLDKIIGKK